MFSVFGQQLRLSVWKRSTAPNDNKQDSTPLECMREMRDERNRLSFPQGTRVQRDRQCGFEDPATSHSPRTSMASSRTVRCNDSRTPAPPENQRQVTISSGRPPRVIARKNGPMAEAFLTRSWSK